MTRRVDPAILIEAQRRFGALPPGHKLIVDLFAGGGGASLGIEQALGRSPDIAINHDAEAVAMHAANHPATWHLISDVWEVAPLAVTAGAPVGLLWASPDCKHFSKAKGGQPVKRRVRALAWVVIKWAKAVFPDIIMLENVEEFATWGPLVQKVDAFGNKVFDLHGSPVMVPCKKRKGKTFHRWRRMLERLGYRVEWRELRACDYGAPTIRKRLVLIARRDALPIVWPAASHGDPKTDAVKARGLKPWRTAAEVIDFTRPCHSIFLTREEGRAAGVKRPLADATMARIARGVKRYVIDAKRPFIVNLTHHGGERTESVDDPFRTVTGAHRGEKALVQPFMVRTDMASAAARNGVNAADDPLRTLTTAGSHAVVQPFLTGVGGRMGQTEPRSVDRPAQTLTAKADTVLVAPIIAYAQHGGAERSAERPLHTVTASRKDQNAIIAPFVTKFHDGQTGQPVDEPLATVTANSFIQRPGGAVPLGVVAPYLVPRYGERPGQDPRTRPVTEPAPVVVPTGNGGSLAAVHLSAYYGEGDGSKDRAAPVDEPARTIPTENRHAVVAAFLAQHNTGLVDHEATEPVSTIVQKGCTQAVVAANLSHQFGQLGTGDVEAPLRTVTAGGNHAALVASFLTKYYGQGIGADLNDPAHTVTTKDRFSLVTVMIDGEPYVIADIGMRMLTDRELFGAQGFPPTYVIRRGLFTENGETVERPLTATSAIRMCGNSVSPPMATALAAANCAHLSILPQAAVG